MVQVDDLGKDRYGRTLGIVRLDTRNVNLELVREEKDIEEIKEMITRHVKYTGSKKAAEILLNWDARLPYFIKVFPMEYRRVLGKMSKEDEATERDEVQHG